MMNNSLSLYSEYSQPFCICITGPTATGKSDIAQGVAKTLNTSVLSADSMQVYKGMDIGTAKVPVNERIVSHFGIDLVDPGEEYSASLYQLYARKHIHQNFDQGRISVMCGGTGFYIRAAIDDYDFAKGAQKENPVREKYQVFYEKNGKQAVWDKLFQLDPKSAEIIHPNNTKRVIRALEMFEAGESYSKRAGALASIKQVIPCVMIGLDMDRDILRTRIASRVDQMFEAGLVDEVETLINSGFKDAVTSMQAIGYKEIVDALDGKCTMDEAHHQIISSTRKYAKRQRIWFRKDKRIHWMDSDKTSFEEIIDKTLKIAEKEMDSLS